LRRQKDFHRRSIRQRHHLFDHLAKTGFVHHRLVGVLIGFMGGMLFLG
jgi:hypothetical protein